MLLAAVLVSLLGLIAAIDDSATALYFSACGPKAEAWELLPSAHGPQKVSLQSRDTRHCVTAGASPLITAPCSATDEAQLFHWNATTKNGTPKGTTGFVRSASAALGCPNKGGAGSEGCCITNNGQAGAVMWGCCPSGPSDCGNQVLRLHADGTLHDDRNPSDCLQRGQAPPPPPPPPPPPRVSDPFDKLGASRLAKNAIA